MKSKLVLFIALLTGGSLSFVVTRGIPAQNAKVIEITADEFNFEPGEIALKEGEPVTLILKSVDVSHGLRFSELNVNLKAKKGETATATFTPDRTGDFTGHCSVFCGSGHGSMKLVLHVVK